MKNNDDVEIRNYNYLKNVKNYHYTDEQRELVKNSNPEWDEILKEAGELDLYRSVVDTMRAMMWQENFHPSLENLRFAFNINK